MKSNEINVFTLGTMLAAADLSAKQYYPVKVDSSGTINVCSAGEASVGFLRNKPTSGQVCEIMNVGVALAVVGDTITAGNTVMAHANGIQPHTGSNAKIGVALQDGAIGEVISVLLSDAGLGVSESRATLCIPVKLANVADGDLVTTWTPGFSGTLRKISFIVTDAVTTADKATTLNLEIGTTNVTGGVLALTSANCTPLGAVVDGTAITALNTFGASDTISVEASSTTTFIEGEGVLVITYSN